MLTRVKDILQKKGLRMSDLAERIGMDQSNLQKSLNRNPTLSTIKDVASALNVPLSELFSEESHPRSINRIAILDDGKTYGLLEIPGLVHIPHYDNYTSLRDVIRQFIHSSIEGNVLTSICGIIEALELFCLVYDCETKKFVLSICYEEKKMLTFSYDLLEVSNFTQINLEQLCSAILNDLEGAVLLKNNR